MRKIDRLNETNVNIFGTTMKIIENNNYNDIWIEFQDEYKVKMHTTYDRFLRGNISSPYDKTIYGIGYIGEGEYSRTKNNEVYKKWFGMLARCYDPYELNKNPTYINCTVCKEWHNLQNFAKWYEENYYEIPNESMELDKDILIKGNKIYSPQTCIFVPHNINCLFIKNNSLRGDLPIGVGFHKRDCKFYAQCNFIKGEKKKRGWLGYFDSEEEAFTCYKNFKEKYIKQVADEYKDLIPIELYEAMYRWEIEITD